MNMKRIGARVIGVLMALALSVGVLASVLWTLGTSAPVMEFMFRHFGSPQASGLPMEDYPAMTRMITGYLAGDVDEFQFSVDGTPQFHDYEQQHMADCRELFALDRRVLIGAVVILAVLAGAAIWLREPRGLVGGFFAGCLGSIAVIAAVAGLCMASFDSVFVLFHRLSFSNSLWLLNPYTDLLIRLMPIGFFMSCAAIGGAVWLLAMGLLAIISGLKWFWFKHKR